MTVWSAVFLFALLINHPGFCDQTHSLFFWPSLLEESSLDLQIPLERVSENLLEPEPGKSWSSEVTKCPDNERSACHLELRRLGNAMKSGAELQEDRWYFQRPQQWCGFELMGLEIAEGRDSVYGWGHPQTLAPHFYFRSSEEFKAYHWFNCGPGMPLYPTCRYQEWTLSQWSQGLTRSFFSQKAKMVWLFPFKGWKASTYAKQDQVFFLLYKEFLAATKNHDIFIHQTLTQPKAGEIYFTNWITGLPQWLRSKKNKKKKNLPAMLDTWAGDKCLIPGRKISWRRKWQSTSVSLPGKSESMRLRKSWTRLGN